MRFVQSILLAALLCGCGMNDSGDIRAAALNPPIAQAPDYRAVDIRATGGGFSAIGCYGANSVDLVRPTQFGSPLPPVFATLTLTTAGPQAMVAGADSAGFAFLVVFVVDYSLSQTTIELYRDLTGNGLPDQTSQVVLQSVASAHYVRAVLDTTTGTTYAYDGLNDTIVRFADTNADLIPDVPGGVFASAGSVAGSSIKARALVEPKLNSVRYFPAGDAEMSFPGVHQTLTDTTGNGVADQAVIAGPYEHHYKNEWGDIYEVPFEGNATISVKVEGDGSYEIIADHGTSTTVLATFTGNGTLQVISLTSALSLGDEVVLRDAAANLDLHRLPVVPQGETVPIRRKTPEILSPVVGESIVFKGHNFTTADTVDCRLLSGSGSWTSCTVDSVASSELSITVPSVVSSGFELVEFRITTGAGDAYDFLYTVHAAPQ